MISRRLFNSLIFIMFVFIFFTSGVFADKLNYLKMPSIFSNNMILQQNKEAYIWGWTKGSGEVVVEIAGQTKSIKSDIEGKWKIKIDPITSHGPFILKVSSLDESIIIENVAVGEVWIASGQSNMQWSIGPTASSANVGVFNSQLEVAEANYPDIRLFYVGRTVADEPQGNCMGKWEVCTPGTVLPYSAVGYLFAKRLHNTLKVPVGIIQACWGGTRAESWMPKEILESDEDFIPILTEYEKNCLAYPDLKKKYDSEIKMWQESYGELEKKSSKVPPKPGKPEAWSKYHYRSPYKLYNSMISPLIPYGIRGVIWYQGESNVWKGYQYRKLFPALIRAWRNKWDIGDFPFYYVQLPPYNYSKYPVGPMLREAQLLTLNVPNTGMAVTMDIGNPDNIHPRNKKPVADRLALWAFSKIYGFKDIVYSGPIYRSMSIEKNKIRLFFDHTESGLFKKGEYLSYFEIAGEDRKYVPAIAEIDGTDILVFSENIPKPIAVRYAWSNIAQPNLYNLEGLPASPFRTDDW